MKMPETSEAQKYLIEWIKNPRNVSGYSAYGYDFTLTQVTDSYLEEEGADRHDSKHRGEVSPPFLAAAWELCRIGIIRPGVRKLGLQVTDVGNGGDGYSVTPYGEKWLAEESNNIFIPTEYGRFAELLEPFKTLFGPGFHERAQQANRCYRSHAYLACCAMCGAAAESIMLALAIRKEGDEDKVIRLYKASNGRKKIEDMLTGSVKEHVRREFTGLVDSLKYWRDESAHGRVSNISDNEAYISLSKLFRFSAFCSDNYQALTGKPLP